MSHTPGPWRVGRTTGGLLGIWSRRSRADSPDVCSVASVPDARDEANAHLMAAAPELLAACKRALEDDGRLQGATRRGDIRAAIAKAEAGG